MVSSVQLWAKETGLLSGTSSGIEIHILTFGFRQYIIQKVSRVRKTGCRPAIIVSGTYLEWFKPAETKSKETPGDKNPKILKPGSKDQNVRAGWPRGAG